MRKAVVALMLVAVAACSHGTPARSTASAVPAPTVSVPPVTSPSPLPPATSAASASASPATQLCTTAQLRLSVHESDAGAGQFHQRLVLTNGGARCSLQGYPGVSFLDAAGHQLGSPAARGTAPPRQVFLDSGTSAAAVLTYANAGACPDAAAGLHVHR